MSWWNEWMGLVYYNPSADSLDSPGYKRFIESYNGMFNLGFDSSLARTAKRCGHPQHNNTTT
jgi:hypothetical protein